jgi:Ni2+-binding GTPase involved in maturation of urease and hydrogenase
VSKRIVIVGGFLGAGKTTLLLRASELLKSQGYRIGFITNDQGENLVDTSLLRMDGNAVTEVAGGCFCCRFPDLMVAIDSLENQVHNDIILAEAVGSCTDLVATVIRPLKKYRPDFTISPLTVLIDATAEEDLLSPNLRYLYRKQLSEADVLVLNKSDLLRPNEHSSTNLDPRDGLNSPIRVSARTGEGIDTWLSFVLGKEHKGGKVLQLDYDRYAKAEGSLVWLNVQGMVRGDQGFSADVWTEQFINEFRRRLDIRGAHIAHVKIQVTVGDVVFKASLVRSNEPIWDRRPAANDGEKLDFLVNARVHADRQGVEEDCLRALEGVRPHEGARYYVKDFGCFNPARPEPTFRIN